MNTGLIATLAEELQTKLDDATTHDVFVGADKLEISKLSPSSLRAVVSYESIQAETENIPDPYATSITRNVALTIMHRSMSDDEAADTIIPAATLAMNEHYFRFLNATFDRQENGGLTLYLDFHRIDAP